MFISIQCKVFCCSGLRGLRLLFSCYSQRLHFSKLFVFIHSFLLFLWCWGLSQGSVPTRAVFCHCVILPALGKCLENKTLVVPPCHKWRVLRDPIQQLWPHTSSHWWQMQEEGEEGWTIFCLLKPILQKTLKKNTFRYFTSKMWFIVCTFNSTVAGDMGTYEDSLAW